MLPKDYPGQNCSIARTLEVLGDRWTLLIVRESLGRGVRRFDGFLEQLGIAKNVLSDRLDRLCEEGLLRREIYQQHPTRYEYHPTRKALDLWPVLVAMIEWGDAYYAPMGPPKIITHDGCEGRVGVKLACESCGREIEPHEVTGRPGPGSRRRAPATAQVP